MSAPDIRAVAAADHAAWLPLWKAYQAFYKVDLPEQTSRVLWARLLDPAEPVHGALAWDGATAVGLAHWLTHRFTWSPEDLLPQRPVRRSRAAWPGRRAAADRACLRGGAGRRVGQVYWLTHETNTTAQALYNRVATRTGFIHYGHKLD